MTSTIAQLTAASRIADSEAFFELIRDHHDKQLLELAMIATCDLELAEKTMIKGCVRAFDRGATGDYYLSIAREVLRSGLKQASRRKKKRRARSIALPVTAPLPSSSPSAEVVADALEHLGSKQRFLVETLDRRKWSLNKVASLLDEKPEKVQSQLVVAQNLLLRRFQKAAIFADVAVLANHEEYRTSMQADAYQPPTHTARFWSELDGSVKKRVRRNDSGETLTRSQKRRNAIGSNVVGLLLALVIVALSLYMRQQQSEQFSVEERQREAADRASEIAREQLSVDSEPDTSLPELSQDSTVLEPTLRFGETATIPSLPVDGSPAGAIEVTVDSLTTSTEAELTDRGVTEGPSVDFYTLRYSLPVDSPAGTDAASQGMRVVEVTGEQAELLQPVDVGGGARAQGCMSTESTSIDGGSGVRGLAAFCEVWVVPRGAEVVVIYDGQESREPAAIWGS